MVVMTAKVSKAKLIAVVVILAAIVCVAVLLLRGGGGGEAETAENAPVNSDITTNERRVAYLSAYGWDVSADPVETQEVMIPEEMNEVYEKYNELQRSQGFDLTRFAGKQVKRYVYQITNYGGTDPAYATLLIYKGSVIGGDVTSTAGEGLMHGFAMPSGTGTTSTPAADSGQSAGASDSASEGTQGSASNDTQPQTDNTQSPAAGTENTAGGMEGTESASETGDDALDSSTAQTELPAA